ncbi:MAG: enoyl-CoA hydratase/isomerase family protein [Actinomycetota bacterium]|jgi:enoyl-CoA hydratase|nr:enoyl-CoA hydratase/isomerase family protein [Actinomycetota bacterium]
MADISVERIDAATVITIDRPEVLNAITHRHAEEIGAALGEAGADRSCRSVVLTGTGRAFCAGIDVKSVASRDAAGDAGSDDGRPDPILDQFEGLHVRLGNVIRIIHSLPVPVIAAVNGHAIGAGFAMAAASDLRLASTEARFADGFVARGISGCELGLSYFLPKVVGSATAFDWMVTGRRIGADEAHAAGLVSAVTQPEELLERALELAAAVAANAPAAVAMTKDVMWANVHASSLEQALALESRTQVMVRNTADAAEARNAFLEKRTPQFAVPAGSRPLR